MKILSIDQIREADKYTIEKEAIASVDLMERAANACVDWIKERYSDQSQFKIVCGQGNNGGDGLAIARLLIENKYEVQVFIVHYSDNQSEDFKINFQRLKVLAPDAIKEIIEVRDINSFSFGEGRGVVIIDALLGSGLSKPVTGLLAECISFINNFNCQIISIDIPSGLYGDKLNNPSDVIIKANNTLTFQFPKLSFMFSENSQYVGVFTILDIGLHSEYITTTSTQNYFTTKNDVIGFLRKRNKSSHKGNFGHALIIAGSYGKIGAAILSSKACMRSGVGLLTTHVPKCGYEILQTSIPEAMIDSDTEEYFVSDNIKLEKYNAIGIGPGLGTEYQTQNVVKLLIQNSTQPIVFDADAINIIAENKTWLSFIHPESIYTPHPKEFERLVGRSENSEERLKLQRDFSIKYNVYIVLKGAHTAISCPSGNVLFNSTGNPGMATAGSGDVLTGIITSLLTQGYMPQQACILGVYLHGLAGDFAAHEKTEESMIASDIIENLGGAFRFLSNREINS